LAGLAFLKPVDSPLSFQLTALAHFVIIVSGFIDLSINLNICLRTKLGSFLLLICSLIPFCNNHLVNPAKSQAANEAHILPNINVSA